MKNWSHNNGTISNEYYDIENRRLFSEHSFTDYMYDMYDNENKGLFREQSRISGENKEPIREHNSEHSGIDYMTM